MRGICSGAAPLAAVLAVLAGTSGASAHATLQPREAVAGGYLQATLTVPHGCAGSATIAVRVKIPDGILSVKPQMKPSWSVEIKKRKLDKPQQGSHGETISEVVDEVIWRGGPLPDHLYDTFGLVMKLPDTPDQTLYFPAVQECEQGVARWIEIPSGSRKASDLREPAPKIRLVPKTAPKTAPKTP